MAEATTVLDHKWFDLACHADGCRSLILEAALEKLAFMAMTSGGTVGPDPELQKAISEATALLSPRSLTPTESILPPLADHGKSVDTLMDRATAKRRHAAVLITDAEMLEKLAYDTADYCGGGEP